MAATYGSGGTASEGTTSVAPAYPSNVGAGQLLLLHVVSKYPPNGPATPAGWTLLGQATGGVGAPGADSGDVYSTVFWKIADGSETSAMTVAVTITSGNVARAVIHRINKASALERIIDPVFTTGADDNAADTTNFSATGAAGLDLAVDDFVLAFGCANTDAASYTGHAFTATGATFGTVTERSDAGSSLGDDLRILAASGSVTAGSSNATPVYTATASTGAPTGAVVFVRVRTTAKVGAASAGTSVTVVDDAALSVTWSSPVAGDLLLITAATKYPGAQLSTPQGFNILAQVDGGAGAEGVGSGNVRLTVFYRVSDGTETSTTIPTSGSSITMARGQIWRGLFPSTKVWDIDVTTGADSTSGTDLSVTGAAVLDLAADDELIVISAKNANATHNANVSTIAATDATFVGLTENHDTGSASDDAIALTTLYSRVLSGPASTAPVHTATLSGAAAGPAVFIRLREVTPVGRFLAGQMAAEARESMLVPMISKLLGEG